VAGRATVRKKLIEVALPLPEINDASSYDKRPGIGPHPKSIHHWRARLPLPTARAVLFAPVVDDPSAHPENWTTEEAQNAERERLFGILRKMTGKRLHEHPDVYAEAHAELAVGRSRSRRTAWASRPMPGTSIRWQCLSTSATLSSHRCGRADRQSIPKTAGGSAALRRGAAHRGSRLICATTDDPTDREHEKLGYDIESRVPGTGKLRFIEVKGRVTGAATITVTKNEILYSLNKPEDFILAIVEFVDGEAPRVHHLRRPFQREPDFGVTSVNYDFDDLVARAAPPS
jgi:hypothetical protein